MINITLWFMHIEPEVTYWSLAYPLLCTFSEVNSKANGKLLDLFFAEFEANIRIFLAASREAVSFTLKVPGFIYFS